MTSLRVCWRGFLLHLVVLVTCDVASGAQIRNSGQSQILFGKDDRTLLRNIRSIRDTSALLGTDDEQRGSLQLLPTKRGFEFMGKRFVLLPNLSNFKYALNPTSENLQNPKRGFEFMGKRGFEFMGKRNNANDDEPLERKEFEFPDTLGVISKRGFEFMGKRGREFIGKRGFEFMGKRIQNGLDQANYDELQNDQKRGFEFMGKRGFEFIG